MPQSWAWGLSSDKILSKLIIVFSLIPGPKSFVNTLMCKMWQICQQHVWSSQFMPQIYVDQILNSMTPNTVGLFAMYKECPVCAYQRLVPVKNCVIPASKFYKMCKSDTYLFLHKIVWSMPSNYKNCPVFWPILRTLHQQDLEQDLPNLSDWMIQKMTNKMAVGIR